MVIQVCGGKEGTITGAALLHRSGGGVVLILYYCIEMMRSNISFMCDIAGTQSLTSGNLIAPRTSPA